MKGRIGCPTRIVTLPAGFMELARKGEAKKPSAKAKRRLEILDWYHRESPKRSKNGKPNAALTCRHFGIHRCEFYRWKKRHDPKRPWTLEDRSRAPHRKRWPKYTRELVGKVHGIRKADPTYSAKKIRPILLRQMPAAQVPSVATIGRLISREKLFFRPDTKRRKKHSKSAKKAHERKRKPYNLPEGEAARIVEFDMKHVYLLGMKLYAFCSVVPTRKEALIHIASSPSSLNAKKAAQKMVARLGKNIVVVNDNGSENMLHAQQYFASQEITQYWTHPRSPKEKPFVERLIGSLQRECLDYRYEPMNVAELQAEVDMWLDKYHHYRPHESLEFLTPAEYSAKLGIPIPRRTGVL